MSKGYTTTITIGKVDLELDYWYDYDKGYFKNSNGDGLPPSQDLEIMSIKIGKIECMDLFFDTCMFDTIEEALLEKIKNDY